MGSDNLLSVGLFNMFQNPEKMNANKSKIAFSQFLAEVDPGRVVQQKLKEIILMEFFLTEITFLPILLIIQT